ncbi:MAG: ferredoxin family protein [Lachnospiraceae bacterium]|nr:ferredoxin family protein [Lachnospiraceae bacterium]
MSGLVQTNEKCIGCNKCISVCSCDGANVAVVDENGRNIIHVEPDKCIACGACISVCEHGAREFIDDTERFFNDLKAGEQISILLAPAFKANYPKEYELILGQLKKLGVKRIMEVIKNVNERTDKLTASSEKTTESIVQMSDITKGMESDLENLITNN